MKQKVLILLIILSMNTPAADKKKAPAVIDEVKAKAMIDDPSIEFKETKFLQLERVNVPPELKKIQEQIKQNIIDVVFVSKTHTPVYAQKRDGYTDSYRKFFGVELKIDPIVGEPDSYQVHYFYYNWTTNKNDKTLYKKISKFNVINEVRYGMYELLFGKEYVDKNRDVIDVQNYERIQEVRKAIQEQERIDKIKKKKTSQVKKEEDEDSDPEKKKKKKLIREDPEKENKETPINIDPENQPSTPPNSKNEAPAEDVDEQDSAAKNISISTPAEKKEKEGKKKAAPKKPDDKKNEMSKSDGLDKDKSNIEEPGRGTEIKLLTTLDGLVGTLIEYTTSTTSDNKVKTYTNLRHIGFGGRLEFIQDKIEPRGYTVGFKLGIPILKQKYSLPVYHSIQFDINKYDYLIPKSKFAIGLDYTPINFVNVPSFGDSFQVFENNFMWLKLGVGYKLNFKEHLINLNATSSLSLFGSSSQKKTLSGIKYGLNANTMLVQNYGIDLTMQNVILTGDLAVTTQIVHLAMIYHFEN